MKNKFMKVMSTVLSLCMISCMLNGMPSMAEPLQANSPEYPQSFDLREYGLVTSVKDQGDDSTCVSFSTMGTIETSLVDTNPLIDLSEYHFAYFNCYKTAPDESTDMKEFRNYGSKTISAVATLAAWIGAVAESVLPYGTEVGLITESMRMLSEYRLQNSEMLSAYSEERMNINSPVGKLTNNEIKEILYDKNAVSITVSYSKSYYNSENAAYFKNYSGSANHALVIVGWDDAFSRDNFNYYCRPENDGAWLVKNSWGTGWGDDGYFWISYEDKSICDANTFIVEPSDNYANNYQYDSYGWSTSISANNMDRYSSYMANVFTAEENESITAVGFYTTDRSSEYEIKIYRGLTDPCDPISGEAGKVTTGTERYPGYHTVALNEGVEIEKGESFSVVVRLKNPEALYPIAAEAAIIVDERGFNDNIGPVLKDEIKASTEAGQSFISADGVKWLDTNGMKQTRTVEDYIYGDLEASIYLGNVCLKAFSNPTDRIYFSEHSGDVPLGTAVELSGAPEIHYTTDGSTPDLSSPVYSNPIIINAETTIRAFGVYDGKHGSVYTSVYTQGRSALSGLSIDSVPSELYDENGMIKNFKLECSKSQIELSPCSTAKITINGEQVKSSGKIIVPLDFGENTIEIRTFGETGKKETEYTLSAFRSYAFVDYYEERIKFDGSACMVTAENGHRFGENERISDYLGGVLTVKSEDSEYTIKLPERIILENNVNIKTAYSTEALSGLFSYSYDLVYSNYADMRNALPITYRRIDLMLETRFLIYPGEETDLYFQLPATNQSPASTIVHYRIPDRENAPDDSVRIGAITENSVELYVDTEFSRAYYSIEQVTEEIPYVNEKEKPDEACMQVNLIDELQKATRYRIRVRFDANEERFAPYSKFIEFTTAGEREDCSINFKDERIYVNDVVCDVMARDEMLLHNYDIITPYIGETLTVIPRDGREQYEYTVPSRPAAPVVDIDYINGCLKEPLPENTVFTKTFSWGADMNDVREGSSISDSNGIVYMDELFKSAFKSGDILHFWVDSTESSFESDVSDLFIPEFAFTPQSMLRFTSVKSDKIVLEYYEGLEYGIKTSRKNYTWQDSPVFEGLTPETYYRFAVRYKSTENRLFSQPVYNNITTPMYVTEGDIDGDGECTADDYVLLKLYIMKKENFTSVQLLAADINGDGCVNVLDLIKLNTLF